MTNGLLYKKHRILDQVIYQVVLPKERRIKVMSLAHEEPFGGHLGDEQTGERINLSFVWPKMRREIDKFSKSCEKCQLKARSLVMDRVPITPIPREDIAFKRRTMDVVGPIEPTSAAGHKYCLYIVDSCTRWPAAEHVLRKIHHFTFARTISGRPFLGFYPKIVHFLSKILMTFLWPSVLFLNSTYIFAAKIS